ncbi:MAG: lipid-A-disaccharide synthase [Rikenellaceae bacterium]|jgi:lipid-A-disaccharide synthase|nr:lipid-A-disaccharide synthase [Rikenellaceae bacterium]
MKYYLIAGEASGDLHGSNLVKGIRRSDPGAEFRFWGGDKMAAAGGEEGLAKHYKEASFFGFGQVVANLGTVLGQIAECKRDIRSWKPDVVILIDYPGFNFRIARFAHGLGIPVFWYIAPKVWAWKESRVKRIKRYVTRLFIIFPFEVEYFRKWGIEAIYEGNPLVDEIARVMPTLPSHAEFAAENGLDGRPIVGLLAGSRRSEIAKNLPLMVAVARKFPAYQFVVAGVEWIERAEYECILAGSDVQIVFDQTYSVLKNSVAAIVTSGTATLETALIGTPEVVFYRTNPLYAALKPYFLKIPYISLVNLILGREAITELVQSSMDTTRAEAELSAILPNGAQRERMLADFAELREVVGGAGASERAAARMVEILKSLR